MLSWALFSIPPGFLCVLFKVSPILLAILLAKYRGIQKKKLLAKIEQNIEIFTVNGNDCINLVLLTFCTCVLQCNAGQESVTETAHFGGIHWA